MPKKTVNKLSLYTDEQMLLHEMGPTHPERPQRLSHVLHVLGEKHWQSTIHRPTVQPIADHLLKLVHDDAYLKKLEDSVPEHGYAFLDNDTALNANTLKAAKLAAGCVIQAVDDVLSGQTQRAACLIRPPGHHAMPDKAMGFCFYNNVAIGAQYALTAHHLAQVAIIDFDVHHGNGTEAMFKANPKVAFFSLFQDPLFPGVAIKPLPDHYHYYPLPAGTTGDTIKTIFEDDLLPTLRQYNPNLIFISAGFDGHMKDPLAEWLLTKDDFAWMTKAIVEVANQCCDGRVISVLEGGYHLKGLANGYLVHLKALLS